MKGRLHLNAKKEWVIEYTTCQPKRMVTEYNASVALHKNDQELMMDRDPNIWDGKEVEFEISKVGKFAEQITLLKQSGSDKGINNDKIYKAALEYDNTTSYDTPITHFQMGAFWYREQIQNTTSEVQQLSDNVKKAKEEFISEVNRLNYAIQLMDEPMSFVDSSLAGYIRNISRTYEDYINSKIQFTEKYFEEKFK
jgi:hypothetical protein